MEISNNIGMIDHFRNINNGNLSNVNTVYIKLDSI